MTTATEQNNSNQDVKAEPTTEKPPENNADQALAKAEEEFKTEKEKLNKHLADSQVICQNIKVMSLDHH